MLKRENRAVSIILFCNAKSVLSLTYYSHFLAYNGDIWSAEMQQSSNRSNACAVYKIALVIEKV
jgi:hypothetical protein